MIGGRRPVLRRVYRAIRDQAGLWRIASDVVGAGSTTLTPQEADLTSFTNLAAGGSVTIGPFQAKYAPFFDVHVFMDQGGTLQPQVRYQSSGNGSTWRSFGPSYGIVASTLAQITAVRLPNLLGQFVLTNTGAATTTTLELVIVQRSI